MGVYLDEVDEVDEVERGKEFEGAEEVERGEEVEGAEKEAMVAMKVGDAMKVFDKGGRPGC